MSSAGSAPTPEPPDIGADTATARPSITNTPRTYGTFEMLSSVLSGLAFSPRAAEGPCDIYAAGGTPCVAAHSMVRALFGGYDGPLYLVQRASDLATTAVATTKSGFADSAAQESSAN